TNEKTWHKLGLSWGVVPVMVERFNSTDVLFYVAAREAKKAFGLKAGDQIVITGGMTNGVSGNTNLIKVEMIGND
ncbi:MAG: pyruvate kinase alpha/beta domain-containing protein, partial [Candidatus Faecivivens sp.]|nr:pyruvate kinase alpha/beta domain-containing protein [Candidatus Faecivivens sp.]